MAILPTRIKNIRAANMIPLLLITEEATTVWINAIMIIRTKVINSVTVHHAHYKIT